MAINNFERLFLFEFMVQEVCYNRARTMDFNFLNALGPTIVTFRSDSFPSIEMSEDEFGAREPYDLFKSNLKSGKSCLFALSKGSVPPVSDKAQIEVFRRLPPGGCLPVFKFGTAYLKMSQEFLSVLNDLSTCSKCIRVSLDVRNDEFEPIGSIAVFLRLTHFGTTVFTQFQADSTADNKSFAFRGDLNPCPGTYEALSTQGPETAMQYQKLPPNNVQTNNELLLDLLKALSTTLMDYISNESFFLPKEYPKRMSKGVNMPYDINRVFGYNSTNSFNNIGGPNYHSRLRQPLFPHLSNHPNKLNAYSNIPRLPCANQKGLIEHTMSPAAYSSPSRIPIKSHTFENRTVIGDVMSENILSRPEWRSKRSESTFKEISTGKSAAPTSKKSPVVWYKAGDTSDFLDPHLKQ